MKTKIEVSWLKGITHPRQGEIKQENHMGKGHGHTARSAEVAGWQPVLCI